MIFLQHFQAFNSKEDIMKKYLNKFDNKMKKITLKMYPS